MSEQVALLSSIANTISDYRSGEINRPSPGHVNRWVQQFDKGVQFHLLQELDFVLKKTYLNRKAVERFLRSMVSSAKISGGEQCAFWARTTFLNIQANGHSQQEMLDIVDKILRKECNLSVRSCGETGGDYIYVDDVMFSGSRVAGDLEAWITSEAPAKAKLHIVVAALHTGGEYFADKRLKQATLDSGKEIEIKYWRMKTIENRKFSKYDSEVLWPTEVPSDIATQKYVALPHKFPLNLRTAGGNLGPFSSERGRQLLEREFLIAGVKIRGLSKSPKDILRPLGFSPFGVGFGSMTVTYRNCPNNCPLAFWWGDPEATSGPFSWYPLFPRKTYSQAADPDDIPF